MNKIKYVKGDVVEALKNGEIDYLVHCCNSIGVMGSGIAKQIRKEFPEAYSVYQDQCAGQPIDGFLGGVTEARGVINLVGQRYYKGYRLNFDPDELTINESHGRFVNYGAIASGFINMSVLTGVKRKIGFPYLFASDRAGGDWNIIVELIEQLLCPWYDVYVYKL